MPPMTGRNPDFSTCTSGNQQSCLRENSVRRMLYEIARAFIIYNKRILITSDCVKFCRCIAWHWQKFLVNNFADFPDPVVPVKKLTLFSCWWRLELVTSPTAWSFLSSHLVPISLFYFALDCKMARKNGFYLQRNLILIKRTVYTKTLITQSDLTSFCTDFEY